MTHPLLLRLSTVATLSDTDRDCVAHLIGEVHRFKAGDEVLKKGDNSDHAMVLLEGWASQYKQTRSDKYQILAILLPGDFCETHVCEPKELDFSVKSLSCSMFVAVPRNQIRKLCFKPEIATAFSRLDQIHEASLRARLTTLGQHTSYERLAHLICELWLRADHLGMIENGTLPFPVRQIELCQALGMTSVHLNRVVQRMRAAGLITMSGNKLTVPDMPLLADAVGFDPSYLRLPA